MNDATRLRMAIAALAFAAVAPLANAASVHPVSGRNPSVVLPAGGNGNSVAPSLSPDGRYVVFSSSAIDLVPGENSQPRLDVFLRDRLWNTTTLVSGNFSAAGGGNADSTCGQVSSSGRYVVFQSDASDLVLGDTNGVSDIFLRDMVSGTTLLVSVATDGGFANGACTDPVITPDGTCVVFISSATNLVAGDANGIPDVFVRDLITQTTRLVSGGAVCPAGRTTASMATPAISADGRFVAFFSDATGLAAGAPAVPSGEIYVRDLQAGATTWASQNATAIVSAMFGSTSGMASYHPRLSDGGRYVAFKAGSTNSGDANVILQFDSIAGTTAVVNTNGIAVSGYEDDAFGPEMTPDGSLVAFARREGAAISNNCSVHVWNSLTLVDTLVSDPGVSGVITTSSRAPVLASGGGFVVFLSNATNLVGNAVSNGFHVYRCDLSNGARQLMDADMNGVGSTDDELASLSVSADGKYVAFTSPDGSLVPLDKNRAEDVFVRNVANAATELISRRNPTVLPQTGDAFSSMSQVSVSADGHWVAFASSADDLVVGDTNGVQDVFVRDLRTGSNILVSVGFDGSAASGVSQSPIISADGSSVAFISMATNLVAGQTNSGFNVFLRNLQAATTILVSVSKNPTTAIGPGTPYFDPVISADGRFVAYVAQGRLPNGTSSLGTYWRDVTAPSAVWLGPIYSRAIPYPISMSGNGRYVAYTFSDVSPNLWLRIRDTQIGADIYTNPCIGGPWTSAALSPDGSRLLYAAPGGIYASYPTLVVYDFASQSNLLSIPYPAQIRNASCWSADSRYLAFVSSTNILSSADDGTNKVYLCDLQTGTITLVGVSGPDTGSMAAMSDSPAISADGRFVAYRSAVTNYMVGDMNIPPNIFLYDRLSATTTVLTAGQAGTSPVSWVSRPAISGSGNTVAFLDLGSGLVDGDLNQVEDAFAAAPDIGTALDSDGDGIPDWWMLLHFGHATGQAGDLSRAGDDSDGDGMSNWQEWIAGTDPRDGSSRLRMLMPVRNQSGINLSWESVDGVTYFLQRTTLRGGDPFSSIQSNITGQAGTTTCADTNTAGQSQLFYRVGVQ